MEDPRSIRRRDIEMMKAAAQPIVIEQRKAAAAKAFPNNEGNYRRRKPAK